MDVAVSTAAGGSGSESPLPNWVMLDRYPFVRYDLSYWKEDETTSQQCRTSQGDPFRVSFRFVAPPAISRFYVHIKGGSIADDCENSCYVIASHRNALLFCLLVPLPVPVEYLSNPESEPFPRFFKQDLFVYTASNRPLLKLLPPCLEVGNEDDKALYAGERLYNPLAGIIQFPIDCEELGILCNDDGDYAVAYLCVSREISSGSGAKEVEAQLCLYFSSDSHWELHGLPICCENNDFDVLYRWSTKSVVAFGTSLCWIDYHRGILFCDVFAKPPIVRFLSLPVKVEQFPHVCMDLYRSISVVNDEGTPMIKFIDIKPSRGYPKYPTPDDSKISVFSLVMEDSKMTWILDNEVVITADEPCISKHFDSPHGPLMFPVVGVEEPYVGYMVVRELGCGVKKVVLVSIDLISGSVKEVYPYLNGDKDLFTDDADMAISKSNSFEPFLPCGISMLPLTGDTTSTRKVLVSLSSSLQGGLPASIGSSGTCSMKGTTMLPIASSKMLMPDVESLRTEASTGSAQNIFPRSVFPQGGIGNVQVEGPRQVSFRLLCPVKLAGGLIGKKGLTIKRIENETGACIDIGPHFSGCMERVVTIAAIEDPEHCCKVQGALLRVFERMVNADRHGRSLFSTPSQCSVRALVHKSQVGYLVGPGSVVINKMMEISRARIQMLDTYVPACASYYECVLQITGEILNITSALSLLSRNLCNQVFSSKRTNYYNEYVSSSNVAEMNTTRKNIFLQLAETEQTIFMWKNLSVTSA